MFFLRAGSILRFCILRSPRLSLSTHNYVRAVESNRRTRIVPNLCRPPDSSNVAREFADVTYQENRSNCDLPSDTPLYYVVTAVDEHFNESVFSQEFSAVALPND